MERKERKSIIDVGRELLETTSFDKYIEERGKEQEDAFDKVIDLIPVPGIGLLKKAPKVAKYAITAVAVTLVGVGAYIIVNLLEPVLGPVASSFVDRVLGLLGMNRYDLGAQVPVDVQIEEGQDTELEQEPAQLPSVEVSPSKAQLPPTPSPSPTAPTAPVSKVPAPAPKAPAPATPREQPKVARPPEPAAGAPEAPTEVIVREKAAPPVKGNGLTAEMYKQVSAAIPDPTERAMFLAQTSHESVNFTHLSENLGYSFKALKKLQPNIKNLQKYTDAQLTDIANAGPVAVGNAMYGGRMGNAPDEGYKYRGRGYIQLTGKKNYEAAGRALGVDLVGNPDLASSPSVAMKIALQWWKDRPALVKAGRAGDVAAATQIINGGSIGLSDRKQRFTTYLAQETGGGVSVAQAQPTPITTSPADKQPTTPVKASAPAKTPSPPSKPSAPTPAAPGSTRVASADTPKSDSRYNSGTGSGPGYTELVKLPSGALAYY